MSLARPVENWRILVTPTFQSRARQISKRLFFALELRTQSLEKQFAHAAGLDFSPSADNLQADLDGFGRDIDAYEPQLLDWLASPAGARAQLFINGLKETFAKEAEVSARLVQWPEAHVCLNDSSDRGADSA